jgi:hypothetical protein
MPDGRRAGINRGELFLSARGLKGLAGARWNYFHVRHACPIITTASRWPFAR